MQTQSRWHHQVIEAAALHEEEEEMTGGIGSTCARVYI